MGNKLSSSAAIDGLGTKIPYAIPRPTAESTEKLNQLIRANNATYAIYFNHRKFHNHLPHSLASIYYLGATPEQLTAMYEREAETLVPWKEDSPQVITNENWTQYFDDKNFERGYFDYFSDKISDAQWDWRKVTRKFLLDKDENMFDGLVGGILHPLIHLGYAQELDSGLVAAEALSLCACEYQDFSRFIDPNPELDHPNPTNDPVKILEEIREDPAFDIYTSPKQTSPPKTMRDFPEKIRYYTNRLEIDPKNTLITLLKSSAVLFTASHQDGDPQYDFFLLHCLTSSHESIEILMSSTGDDIIPAAAEERYLKLLWCQVVATYITQCRPSIKPSRVTGYEIESKEAAWKEAVELTLSKGERFYDLHLCKAIRALLFTEVTYGEENDDFYAKAALQYARNFNKNGYANANGHTLDLKNVN